MFGQLGVPVYFADDEAKRLMVTSTDLRERIIERFGDNTYDEKGLNTRYLAERVFNDRQSLEALNALVHPEVEKHFRHWVSNQNSNYVLQENPLLFEKNKQDQYDAVVLVTAPTELRIDRVMSRDGSTRAEVEARIRNQMDEESKTALATYVIENSGDLERCRDSVRAIHESILSELP